MENSISIQYKEFQLKILKNHNLYELEDNGLLNYYSKIVMNDIYIISNVRIVVIFKKC